MSELSSLFGNWLLYEYDLPDETIINKELTLEYWRDATINKIETDKKWINVENNKCLFFAHVAGFRCDNLGLPDILSPDEFIDHLDYYESQIGEMAKEESSIRCLFCEARTPVQDSGFCEEHQDLIEYKEEYLSRFEENEAKWLRENLKEFRDFAVNPRFIISEIKLFTEDGDEFFAELKFREIIKDADFPGPR